LEYVYIQIFPHTKGSIFQFVSDIVWSCYKRTM
jgi:hypothetical protein